MSEIRILSLETSTSVCSVALHADGKLLSAAEIHKGQSQASKLAVLIDEVIKAADIEKKSLHAIAVAAGPGSYTGLRIGTSTAKGLCFALNIPLVAIGTLELMASQVGKINLSRAKLCPMIDARRMEVYCALFSSSLNILQPVQAKIIDEQSFEDDLDSGPIIFFGDGAAKCKNVLTRANALFLDDIVPSAQHLGILAYEKYHQGTTENLVNFEPRYLKEFMIKVAERKN